MKNIHIHLIYIAGIILLTSCGARKVNKSITTTDSTATFTQVVKTDSVSKETTDIYYDITTDDIIIEPIDSTKAIEITDSFGKVTKVKNARISRKKKTDNTIVANTKEIAKNVLDSVFNKVVLHKSVSTKVVDKKQFDILGYWWLWLLIVLACYLGYRWFKK